MNRIILFLSISVLTLACKDNKPDQETEQERYYRRLNEELDQKKKADSLAGNTHQGNTVSNGTQPVTEEEQPPVERPGEEKPVTTNNTQPVSNGPVKPGADEDIWKRIEYFVNYDPVQDGPFLNEVKRKLGNDTYHGVREMWSMVHFNKKKGKTKGSFGITEANFGDKYDIQYEIAQANGY